jgi:phosphoglycolate phosphatase
MRDFDAIVFDLDGTLIDSLDDIALALDGILAELGLPTHGRDAYRYFIGEGARHLVHEALPEERRSETDAFLARFRERYFANLVVSTAPYEGIPELLRALAARDVPMAVLSNKPHEATVVLVERFFDRAFRAVLGAKPNVPKKPDPTAALDLSRALATAPSRVALVGDSKTDMETARAAGMIPIGVLWGFRDREELESHGAEHILAHPSDLLAIAPSG